MVIGAVITEYLKVPFVESFLFHTPFDRFNKNQLNVTDLKDQVISFFWDKKYKRPEYLKAEPPDSGTVRFSTLHWQVKRFQVCCLWIGRTGVGGGDIRYMTLVSVMTFVT